MTTAPRPIHRPVSALNQSLFCTASTARWSAQEIYLARLSGLSRSSQPPSGIPRRFEAAEVAILIDQDADLRVVEARQVAGQQVGLAAAQLEQEGAAGPQPSGTLGQHTTKDGRPIRASVV